LLIDIDSEFGRRVEKRLREDPIIWLVTVAGDGTPVPSPVWFHWDGSNVLIYSQPNTPKLRNIERNPRVALHFDSVDRTDQGGHDGENIVVVSGTATIDSTAPGGDQHPGFIAKYAESGRCDAWSTSLAELARDFSVAIRVTPMRIRGF
jgi:PPOX class probable F420-dependent enzyme